MKGRKIDAFHRHNKQRLVLSRVNKLTLAKVCNSSSLPKLRNLMLQMKENQEISDPNQDDHNFYSIAKTCKQKKPLSLRKDQPQKKVSKIPFDHQDLLICNNPTVDLPLKDAKNRTQQSRKRSLIQVKRHVRIEDASRLSSHNKATLAQKKQSKSHRSVDSASDRQFKRIIKHLKSLEENQQGLSTHLSTVVSLSNLQRLIESVHQHQWQIALEMVNTVEIDRPHIEESFRNLPKVDLKPTCSLTQFSGQDLFIDDLINQKPQQKTSLSRLEQEGKLLTGDHTQKQVGPSDLQDKLENRFKTLHSSQLNKLLAYIQHACKSKYGEKPFITKNSSVDAEMQVDSKYKTLIKKTATNMSNQDSYKQIQQFVAFVGKAYDSILLELIEVVQKKTDLIGGISNAVKRYHRSVMEQEVK